MPRLILILILGHKNRGKVGAWWRFGGERDRSKIVNNSISLEGKDVSVTKRQVQPYY